MIGWRKAKPTVNVVALLGAFLLFAALVWAMWHYTQPAPLGEDRVAVRKKALAEVRATETESLNHYGWVDPARGVVRLPIAEAIRLDLALWQNPAQARSNLIARAEKAFPPMPVATNAPSTNAPATTNATPVPAGQTGNSK